MQPDETEATNFPVLRRLAEAWNPPDVAGAVTVMPDGKDGRTLLCVEAEIGGRRIAFYSAPFAKEMLWDQARKRDLAGLAYRFFQLASKAVDR